jgi:hypothetical protein
MANLTDPKTGKRHKIFQDLIDSGKATVRTRKPLPDSVKADLADKMARHKEWLRQGEHYKNHSTQRFG